MASQLFREESKLKGLSGVKTEQGKAGLNVREIKQAESHRGGDGDGMSGAATAFYGSRWQLYKELDGSRAGHFHSRMDNECSKKLSVRGDFGSSFSG